MFLEAVPALWERHFIKAVEKAIKENPNYKRSEHLQFHQDLKKGTSFEGMLAALDAWRHSDLPGARAFALAQMKGPAELDPLTASSRGQFLFDLSGLPDGMRRTPESYMINERRNFDVLVRFAFVLKDTTRQSYRPVTALDPLDELVFGFLEELRKL